MSSVGSGSLTVEVVIAVSVQSRASSSGILVNSDFTSKDTSLWSSGICAVLIASIKFSVDCSLCLDWSVKGCSTVVKYLDSWYVSTNCPIGQVNNQRHKYHPLTAHYHNDSEDDDRSGCRNVSHCHQQFFSELHSPGRSHYTSY